MQRDKDFVGDRRVSRRRVSLLSRVSRIFELTLVDERGIFSFAPLAVVTPLIYLRTRLLIPFIVAHWFVDMLGILFGIILPMTRK
jgi:hypothetical protein